MQLAKNHTRRYDENDESIMIDGWEYYYKKSKIFNHLYKWAEVQATKEGIHVDDVDTSEYVTPAAFVDGETGMSHYVLYICKY